MRWFRQKDRPNFEYCTELIIDFDEQKVAFRSWDNYPKAELDQEKKGQKEAKVFAFDEIGGEEFTEYFSYLTASGFDYFFGEGANDEFYRVLKMSRAEYIAQKYDRKEIIVDLVGGDKSYVTRYGAPYMVVYSEGRYGVVYDRDIGSANFNLPDVSGDYDVYQDFYDRGYFYSSTAKVEQDEWNLVITIENKARKGTFSEVSKHGSIEITLENGKTTYLNLVDRTMHPNYDFFD